MAKILSPELRASFRPRIRHIHVPDLPPTYTPRAIPGKIRDFLHSQVVEQRYIAHTSAVNEPTGDALADMRAWLRQASPPPAVLSFTRRPTYVFPKHYLEAREPWEVDYMVANLKSQQEIVFPPPPNWDPLSFIPFWEARKDDKSMQLDPLAHKWEPGVMILPCAEPMYFGPGQVSIWPVVDLLDNSQRGKRFSTKYEYERILEDTTIQVLKREYGLDAFSIPGKSGVWVESLIPPSELSDVDMFGIKSFDHDLPKKHQNIRRIATVHADFVDNITRHGVSIHVGHPAPDVDRLRGLRVNPWALIRQNNTTTSIVSELALKGFVPQRSDASQQEVQHRSDKKSLYLQTAFDQDSPHITKPLQAMPYSLVSLQPGLRQPTPMGLDNRDLSTAWAHEFARQLGLSGGIVDHVSMVNFPSEPTGLPTKERNIGFMARPVMGEDQLTSPYEQVEVPAIQLREGGQVTKEILQNTLRFEIKDKRIPYRPPEAPWAFSWPLYFHNLTNLLANSIRGRWRDTRLTQLVRTQAMEARIERRWQAIQEAQVLNDAWRTYQNPRRSNRKQSLSEALVADITKATERMRVILRDLQPGRINIPKKKLLATTAHLQEILRSQGLHTANGPENPAGTSAQNTDTSFSTKSLDAINGSIEGVVKDDGVTKQTTQLKSSLGEVNTKSWQGRVGRPLAGLQEEHQDPDQHRNRRPLFTRRRLDVPPPPFTPTRAERLARKDPAREEKRMARVKAAKLGPPKPLQPPFPARRKTSESREEPLVPSWVTGEEMVKLAWLMPSTQRVASSTGNTANTVKYQMTEPIRNATEETKSA